MQAMPPSAGIGPRPWRIVGVSIGLLLLTIFGAGAVTFVQNEQVKRVTSRALRYDVELEDEGDDVRVAVLDLRHFHRNIDFGGTSASALGALDQTYAALLDEIGDLQRLGIADKTVMQPETILALVQRYYTEFRSATELYDSDQAAYRQASLIGLRRIEELDRAAQGIDDLGELLASSSLRRVDDAASRERLTLLALLISVALVGVAVGLMSWRMLKGMQASFVREQTIAKKLEHELRTKTDFIADASHELRTPLTVIHGNAEIGLAAPGNGAQRDVLEEIAAEAARMGRLVNHLLFLARSDAGIPPLEREFVPARWLVSRTINPAQVLANQREVCFTPDIQGDGFLEVDPSRIQQAILILIDNAVKHAPSGTCISLAATVDHHELVIDVADQGPGIPKDELPLIFDRFYQVGKRRARKKDGSGLGLSIAKTIVEAHGGRIEAESQVGRGTRMTIRLPIAIVPDSAQEPHLLAEGR